MRNWARKDKNTDAIDVEMKAGAVVIWLGATWHAGGCLHGRKPRPAAIFYLGSRNMGFRNSDTLDNLMTI